MTARDELIALLKSKRSRRNALIDEVTILDAEISALESTRDQIDRVSEIKKLAHGPMSE